MFRRRNLWGHSPWQRVLFDVRLQYSTISLLSCFRHNIAWTGRSHTKLKHSHIYKGQINSCYCYYVPLSCDWFLIPQWYFSGALFSTVGFQLQLSGCWPISLNVSTMPMMGAKWEMTFLHCTIFLSKFSMMSSTSYTYIYIWLNKPYTCWIVPRIFIHSEVLYSPIRGPFSIYYWDGLI